MKVEQQKDSKQKKIVQIEDLSVSFDGMEVVKHVNIEVNSGEIVGIVGESGSGKSITSLALMGLLSKQAQVTSGKIIVDGEVLREADRPFDERLYRRFQGSRMSMIFQEPMTSLNPTMRIGKQLAEAVRLHCEKSDKKPSRAQIKSRVLDALSDVNLTEPERIYNSYPHELSGGMRQRVMIAMGTICRPGYLLCDEPTTALDVTTQKGILELIKSMKSGHNMGIVFITHDLKLLKNFADEVAVMCRGKVVERGRVEDIFMSPKEDYTKKLIAAIPDRSKKMSAGAV